MNQDTLNEMLNDFEGIIYDLEQHIEEGTVQLANTFIPSDAKLSEMKYLLELAHSQSPDNRRISALVGAVRRCITYLKNNQI